MRVKIQSDLHGDMQLTQINKHPLVTLLTNVGKVYDGKSWKGSSMLKRATGNPEFKWFKETSDHYKSSLIDSDAEMPTRANPKGTLRD